MDAFLFPILLVGIAAMLFFQIRKQKRTVQQQQKLQNSLEVGDRVMTTSGLFATVVATADDSIDLEIAPGVTTTWLRQAVREKVDTDASQEATETDESADEQVSDEQATEQATGEPTEKQKTT